MNVYKFASFLMMLAIAGIIGGGLCYNIGVTGTHLEREAASAFRSKRINAGGWGFNSLADAGTLKIQAAQQERVHAGKLALWISFGVGLLGFGLRISAKNVTKERSASEAVQSDLAVNIDQQPRTLQESSLVDKLGQIVRMKEEGHLSDLEFDLAKSRILAAENKP